MEEYSSSKHNKRASQSKGERRGRADLWVGNRSVGYVLEAKQSWQSMGERATAGNPDIKAKFLQAWEDAGCLMSDSAEHRLAAVFVAVQIPVSQVSLIGKRGSIQIDNARVRECALAWLANLDLQSNGKVDGYAWVFPSKADKFLSKDGKTLYPGTLLVIGERERAHRG